MTFLFAACTHTDSVFQYEVDNQLKEDVYVSFVLLREQTNDGMAYPRTVTIPAGKTITLNLPNEYVYHCCCPSGTFSKFEIVASDSALLYGSTEIIDTDWSLREFTEQVDRYYKKFHTIYTYIVKAQ